MFYEITQSCTGCGMCLSVCPVKAISGAPGRMHRIDNDLCIGCGACAKVCTSASVVDQNGEIVEHEHKGSWLVPVFDGTRCTYCAQCSLICPLAIISIPEYSKIPTLENPRLCTSCLMCQKVCMHDAIGLKSMSEVLSKSDSPDGGKA